MSLLQMSFSGAVMILAVVVIRSLTINQLPKKTFLALWGLVLLRLLIPFSLSSLFSVYSLVGQNAPVMETVKDKATAAILPIVKTKQMTVVPNVEVNTASADSVPVWAVIWAAGVLACALFLAVSYIKCCREFKTSLPVDNAFTKSWLRTHPLKHPAAIRQSCFITAPLTYGIIRPVILMPKSTDWENTESLQYVLAHEYVHIRRHDAVTKLVLSAAFCVHWFNPLVWVMYILANRDIELSCDEAVVRLFGENTKSTYARTLISMEATKSGLTPLCNNFSKNAIEERITAIMKLKKTSLLAILAAMALIVGVATAFATSAPAKEKELAVIPGTKFTDEEYQKLSALQYEGYEDMSVAEYRERVINDTDTNEYIDLLERFWQDDTIWELRDTNETAAFLCYILVPLHAEKWQSRDYNGCAEVKYFGSSAALEYNYTITILDADALTVREFNNVRTEFMEGLQSFLNNKKPEELYDEKAMQAASALEVDRLVKMLSSDHLQITAKYVYSPLEYNESEAPAQEADEQVVNEQEPRKNAYGTQEDYQSLFALKTADYQQMSVADFNKDLLDWGNEDFDRSQRIQEDAGRNDYQIALSDDELYFAAWTMSLSSEENAQMIKSLRTGSAEEDPWCFGGDYFKNTDDGRAWCNLWYQFSYHISDKEQLTIGERDHCVAGFTKKIQAFWEETDLEELLLMTEEDIVSYMHKIAVEYSNELLTISIKEDQVQYEHMDERNVNYD